MTADDEKTINAKFRSVILSEVNRLTMVKRLALVQEEINEAIKVGYTQEQIVDLLATIGIKVTLRQYQNALYQLRKKAKKAKPVLAAKAVVTKAVPAPKAVVVAAKNGDAQVTKDTHDASDPLDAKRDQDKLF